MRRGYNVYYRPEFGGEEYFGAASSQRAAKKLAQGDGLCESQYATARAAGQCGGIEAPDSDGEDERMTIWFGRHGHYCLVPFSR
jgi:hypothetical protein